MGKLLRYKWIALGLLFVMIAGFFFATRVPSEDRYRRLMEQGRYEALAEDLRKVTGRNPGRHDLRLLLAEVELLLDNPAASLGELIAAASGDLIDPDLEQKLVSLIRNNPGQARECLDLLSAAAHGNQSWLWPREMAVRISLAVSSEAYIMETLPGLLELAPEHPLGSKAMTAMSGSSLDTRWQLALLLNDSYKEQLTAWVHLREGAERVQGVLALYDLAGDYPGAMMLYGGLVGGQEGKALLDQAFPGLSACQLLIWRELVLEVSFATGDAGYLAERLTPLELVDVAKGRYIGPARAEFILEVMALWQSQGQDLAAVPEIGEFQLQMLYSAGPKGLTHARLDLIYPLDLWELTLFWVQKFENEYSSEIAPLLDWLAKMPEWKQKIDQLRVALDTTAPAPKPVAVFPYAKRQYQDSLDWWHVSPDANIVLYNGTTDTGDNMLWWYNIRQGRHQAPDVEGLPRSVVWREDSRYVALLLPEKHALSPDPDVLIFNHEGKLVDSQKLHQSYDHVDLFWHGEDLVLSYSVGEEYLAQKLNLTTKTLSEPLKGRAQPMVTATGELLYINYRGDFIWISNGIELERESRGTVEAWIAEDKELLIHGEGGYCIYRLADASCHRLDTDLVSKVFAAGGKVYGVTDIDEGMGVILHLDLSSREWRSTGLRAGEWSSFCGDLFVTFGNGDMLIYRLP